ncbi:MAG: hypothetical protein EA380_02010 [Phycisphaeraceae bacterium]|nr:MAG: hypothetical protein EA380_02010 [Phycisphaeraceae bacterium]
MNMRRLVFGVCCLLGAICSAAADTPRIAITEWMYAGSTAIGGEFVEFTNMSDEPIDMTGWSFDDDARVPGTYDLSGFGIVQPGESVILTEDPAEQFRADWGLGPEIKILGDLGNPIGNNLGRNDEINLYDENDDLVDRLTYGDQDFPGSIRTRWFSGNPITLDALGANDPNQWVLSAVGDAYGSWESAAGDVGNPGVFTLVPPQSEQMAITEWMYAGSTAIGGEFVEFTNVGDTPVNMTGWSFDDDARVPGTYDLSGFGIVQPGESVILTEDPAEQFRADWGLGPEVKILGDLGNPIGNSLGRNDEINLYNAQDELVDRLTYGDQDFPGSIRTRWFSGNPITTDALFANDAYQWTLSEVGDDFGSWESAAGDVGNPGIFIPPSGTEPAPGPVTLSHASGYFTEEFELTMTANDGDIIRYTLDGSTPTESSPEYTGPLLIADRDGDPNYFSHIPTAISGSRDGGILWALPEGEIFKVTALRTRAFRPDGQAGPVETRTFIVHPDGIDRFTMPVIAITFDEDELFGYEQGIYVPGLIYDENYNPNDQLCNAPANYHERGIEWERPAHLEFFEEDGSGGFALDVGLRIHGGCSRVYRRKSLRVYARGDYGQSWINYPLFPGDDLIEFKRLILRNSGNDYHRSLFRDAYLHTLVQDIDVGGQAFRPSIVFLNGEYWGIHNIRERLDKHYLATRKGADPDNVDILTRGAQVVEGDATHFNETYNFMLGNDMNDPENYEWVEGRIDIENFINYYAIQLFYCNTDWPGNNIDFWRPRTPEGRWRWLFFDLDRSFAFNSASVHTVNSIDRIFGLTHRNARIFQRFVTNDGFRDDFINRSADLMNTVFRVERMVSILDDFRDLFAPEVHEHIFRWQAPATYQSWQNTHAGHVLQTFATNRPASHRQHIADSFDLPGTAELTIIQPNPDAGAVSVSTIDLTAEQSPWTGIYFQSVPVPLRGVPADGYEFIGFSELAQIPDENGIVWWTPDTDITLTALFVNCPGDINGDGIVDLDDFIILAGNFGSGPGATPQQGDLNGDGFVNLDDFIILAGNFGNDCN